MCTLTYIPMSGGGYLFTSNRDESPLRPQALPPQTLQVGLRNVTYPKDPQGGGTWIATAPGLSACLLNGAFAQHRHRPPYARSRGLVLLELFEKENAKTFIRKVNLQNVEPFLLVMVEADRTLIELRWDGARKHVALVDGEQKYIWASAQLYKPEYITKRREWFTQWQAENPKPNMESILAFHKYAGEGNLENDVLMNRGGRVQTVSITAVWHEADQCIMEYHDILN